MQQLTRRNFVRVCGLAGATYLVSTKWETVEAFLLNPSQDSSPFEIIRGNFDSPNFSGDNPGNAHKKFWDIEAYIASKGGRPTQAREENLVIIGGGMAGLLSAYYTKDLKPLVLDQADRFGGNSKGEKFGNNTYSIGAAYIGFPAAGGDVDALLTDIGIRDQLKTDESEAYYVHMRGQGFKKFWEGQTDPEHAEKFEEAFKLLEKVYKESYPNIPFDPNGGLTRPQLEAMDAMTAEQWLQEQLGDLHLHLMEYFQLYAWTSFGGALNELSAAQFLNFVAAETGGIGIFEGGNATIIEALCKHLTKINGTDSIRTRSAVLEVKNVEDHVEIIFENSSGALELIRAKAAIMAAPKFVAKALLPDLDTEKKDAWSQIKYRAYVVANVLLTKKQNLEKFDVLFMNGEAPDIKRPFVDAVHTGWVNEFKGDSSILTVYKPLPYDNARGPLLNPRAHEMLTAQIIPELKKMLPEIGLEGNSIAGVRLTRWGHALPLAAPGFLTEESMRKVGSPMGRIAFANQDNLANPAFESCLASAQEASKFIRTLS